MDIVLEIVDSFVADHVYAWALPAKPAPYDLHLANATSQTFSPWQYKPSTYLFSIQPSQAAYMSQWSRDNIYRQSLSLFAITWFFGFVVYFLFAGISYIFVFDKATIKHPKFLKNQVSLEIAQANWSMPLMSALTAPFFLLEVRGYGKFYDASSEGPGWWYDLIQWPFFLIFTDCFIYLIHRGLHSSLLYKRLHKPHHKWILPTPFASHAFHPVDGWAQSLPYHVFPLLFPLQKVAYVGLFIFVNFWTILIHDGQYLLENPIVNGAACHTLHHTAFTVNYGQYTTIWDRLGGSYRKPNVEQLNAEIDDLKEKPSLKTE